MKTLLVAAISILLVCRMTAQIKLPQPFEGDSLSLPLLLYEESSFRRYDYKRASISLQNSQLIFTQPASWTVGVGLGFAMPISKKIWFGTDIHIIGIAAERSLQSLLQDTLHASYSYSVSGLMYAARVQYSLIQERFVMVRPFVGFSADLQNASVRANHDYSVRQGSTDIRSNLDHPSTIGTSFGHTGFLVYGALGIESYLRLFNQTKPEFEVQTEPNASIYAQSRVELWLGAYASLNPVIGNFSGDGSLNDISCTQTLFQFGVRLMICAPSRLIVR